MRGAPDPHPRPFSLTGRREHHPPPWSANKKPVLAGTGKLPAVPPFLASARSVRHPRCAGPRHERGAAWQGLCEVRQVRRDAPSPALAALGHPLPAGERVGVRGAPDQVARPLKRPWPRGIPSSRITADEAGHVYWVAAGDRSGGSSGGIFGRGGWPGSHPPRLAAPPARAYSLRFRSCACCLCSCCDKSTMMGLSCQTRCAPTRSPLDGQWRHPRGRRCPCQPRT